MPLLVPQRPRLARGTVTDLGAGEQPDDATVPYDDVFRLGIAVGGLPDTELLMSVREPTAPEVGTVNWHSGSHGTRNYGDAPDEVLNPAMVEDFIVDLAAEGLRSVVWKWDGGAPQGWDNLRDSGLIAGQARCAARVATALEWVHDTYCGDVDNLAVVGNSGGSSAWAYCLAHYGLHRIIRAAILGSGPPHAALLQGARGDLGLSYFDDSENEARTIDDAFGLNGYLGADGPARREDVTDDPGWWLNSVENGPYLSYPNTRVVFIVGGDDPTVAPAHAIHFHNAIRTPVSLRFAGPAKHAIQGSPVGQALIRDALLLPEMSPGIRQQAYQSIATGTDYQVTFPYPVRAGNMLVAVLRAGATNSFATLTGPDGFTESVHQDFSNRAVALWDRVADGTETTFTAFAADAAGTFAVFELDGLANPVRDITYTGPAQAGVTSYALPTSPDGPLAPVAARELALAVIAASGNNFDDEWTGGFRGALKINGHLEVAQYPTTDLTAVATGDGFGGSIAAAGLLVSYRDS